VRTSAIRTGKKLGRIVHGQPATTNMAFGGDDWKTLSFTSSTMIGSVGPRVEGARLVDECGDRKVLTCQIGWPSYAVAAGSTIR
jgi:hypothetical protein